MLEREDDGGVALVDASRAAAQIHETKSKTGLITSGLKFREFSQQIMTAGDWKKIQKYDIVVTLSFFKIY